MNKNQLRALSACFVMVAGLFAGSGMVQAGQRDDDFLSRWWVGVGIGGGAVNSLAPAPSAGRNALTASMDFGYRLTPEFGLGFEFGAVVPVDGCAQWKCAAGKAQEFAPAFTRMFAVGEFRPRDSGWRFRASGGVSRFCYSRHWSNSAWGWGDTLDVMLAALLDDGGETIGGNGGYRCDGRTKALGGAASVGYDWAVADGAPVSVGLRLTAEAANFGPTPAIDLPAFHHRSLMLTLHLNIN